MAVNFSPSFVRTYDRNHDNVVTRRELDGDPSKAVDPNGDGNITAGELDAAMAKKAPRLAKQKAAITKADADVSKAQTALAHAKHRTGLLAVFHTAVGAVPSFAAITVGAVAATIAAAVLVPSGVAVFGIVAGI